MNQKVFAGRRRQLFRKMEPDSIAILSAAPHHIRNRDVEYSYHPESDFYYLTGFAEPDAVLVIKKSGRRRACMLFCRERDREQEQWTGERLGTEHAISDMGMTESWPIEQWGEKLPELLAGVQHVYFNLGEESTIEQGLLRQLRSFRQQSRAGIVTPQTVQLLDPLLHEMRLIKSAAEIRLMKKAAAITVAAHRRAMKYCRPEMVEGEIEGEILHEFSAHGVRTVAYDSIVAGGNSACTLHYIKNSQQLHDGDLVLIDAGAEYKGYAADITRTFPVNGCFSTVQRQLYEVVLAAQEAAIRQIRPGRRFDTPHRAAVRVITKGLLGLKILKGDLNSLIKDEKYKRFYMHQTSHWLGMDVHDVGEYKVGGKWRQLEPGMVMTVEPGLYIPQGMKGVARKWQGVGIRIEDDVVVTSDGCEVITDGAPRSVAEIESLMAH